MSLLRCGFCLGLAGLSVVGFAQIPDVLIKIDGIIHYRAAKGKKGSIHAYDSLGNYSTVGLSFTLEPGFAIFLAQRMEEIDDKAEDDQLDQFYIEDKGYWRLGKQKLPFGKGALLNETASAAKVNTYLGSEALPLSIAYCDGGSGFQKGLIGRVGTRLGVSFALGNHIGIDTSSLTTFRFPEEAPGRGRGYQEALGLDYGRNFGEFRLRAEYAMLLKGETDRDPDKRVSDVVLWLEPNPSRAAGIGWSRDWDLGVNEFRLQFRFAVGLGIWLEPIIQARDEKIRSAGVSMRVKF